MKRTTFLALLLLFVTALFASPPTTKVIKHKTAYQDVGYVIIVNSIDNVFSKIIQIDSKKLTFVILDEQYVPNVTENYISDKQYLYRYLYSKTLLNSQESNLSYPLKIYLDRYLYSKTLLNSQESNLSYPLKTYLDYSKNIPGQELGLVDISTKSNLYR